MKLEGKSGTASHLLPTLTEHLLFGFMEIFSIIALSSHNRIIYAKDLTFMLVQIF